MKKLVIGLLAAALMAFGFVGISGTSAVACAPGYPGECADTDPPELAAPARIKRGKAAKVGVKVEADGNVQPRGAVTVSCTLKKGKRLLKRGRVVAYSGERSVTLFNLNRKGVWRCTTRFLGVNTQNSRSQFTVRVR